MSGTNTVNRGKQLSISQLISAILPRIDKDRAMQLNACFMKLKNREISERDFISIISRIAGADTLNMAVHQLQSSQNTGIRSTLNAPNQSAAVHQLQSQNTGIGSTPNAPNQSAAVDPLQPQNTGIRSMPNAPNQSATIHQLQSENTGIRSTPNAPNQSAAVHQLQSQNTGIGSTPNAPNQSAAVDPLQPHNTGIRSMTNAPNQSATIHQLQSENTGIRSTPNAPNQSVVVHQLQSQNTPIRSTQNAPNQYAVVHQLQSQNTGIRSAPNAPNQSAAVHQLQSPNTHIRSTPNAPNQSSLQTPPVWIQRQKPTDSHGVQSVQVGQKRPLDEIVSSPSKKQKVSSGAFLDLSIEQLNDVAAVSGVNLREEEEQLFSGRQNLVSDTSRRIVQEEDSILEKIPLQKKLREIVLKSGLKGVSNDVEWCLSMCVEDRMRGLIGNLTRLSKVRADVEKSGHRTIVTSDVRTQISGKVEEENLQKQNEPPKATKLLNKKREYEMHTTTAANAAARAAMGGGGNHEMLSRWQQMAGKAKQKLPAKLDIRRNPSTLQGSRDNQEGEKSSIPTTQDEAKSQGRNQGFDVNPSTSKISVNDVITALERDPMMSKSTLLHKLYQKNPQ